MQSIPLPLTCVVTVDEGPYDGWYHQKKNAQPAQANRWNAANHAEDVVTSALHDVVQWHLEQWETHAANEINGIIPLSLRFRGYESGSVCVQDGGQGAQHACYAGWKRDLRRYLDLNLHVAKSNATEPRRYVIGVPENGVRKGE